jgi:hypothetical protein
MSNFIKKYSTNYTLVSNIVLTDKELSLRAKGLYAYLFSKPDDWEFHPNVIAKDLKESIGQFRATVSELIQKGYIIRKQINKNGIFGGIVYEFTDVTVLKNNRVGIEACSEKSEHGCTSTHNNTESISNTDIISNTDSSIYYNNSEKTKKNEKKAFGEFERVKLTDEEFNKLNDIYGLKINEAIQILDDYLEYKGHKYKSHYAVMKKNNWVYNKVFPQIKPYKSTYKTLSERNDDVFRRTLEKIQQEEKR